MKTTRLILIAVLPVMVFGAKRPKGLTPAFQTSDRCLACHNGLVTPSGRDVSIGLDWRASMMANSSRDPYWLASVRRESIDHSESRAEIEDECSVCHMPITRYEARLRGRTGEIFSHMPFNDQQDGAEAADGVSCSVCHQIGQEKLGTRESFNGGFVIDPPASKDQHREYGPFEIDKGHQRIMRSSTGGFLPEEQKHIRKSEVCATCHTLYTKALGAGGKVIGELPEQMPYPEWLHSDYREKQSCQDCHMPEVKEPTAITAVFGTPREGFRQHVFIAANFFMQNLLNRYRDDLKVTAQAEELKAGAAETVKFLQGQSARINISQLEVTSGRLRAEVAVENLGGHKLPTAYPSRRAWLRFVVRDRSDAVVFESGGLNADGSIKGNDNDADAGRFEPHYNEITNRDQVQVYESILKDKAGQVTTGLLLGVGYAKDNRLLPKGFDKQTANKDIAVYGEAVTDTDFTGGSDRILYSIDTGSAQGPFTVDAELWYEPIGFRWANNLKKYSQAAEPQRFNRYFDSMSSEAAVMLCRARTVR